jgi:exonuclease III
MGTSLRILAWNANGLKHNVKEIILFLNTNKIDILLVSESQTTEHAFVKIPHYTIYYANYPDGTAHAGSVIIIKSNSKHYELELFITNKIQGTILWLEALSQVTPAVYSPPRPSDSAEEYDHFLSQLGTHYLVAGDWNANSA